MSTHRGSMGAPSASVLPTTAPVLDYVCLFTHDLKRKQKRWQDGKLKYHSFNKRVMVYDEKANFIGDMHWNEDYDFGEGEEFQLERGCVIVQVAECIGSKEQDLSELIEKRYKDKEQRQARAAAAGATPSRSRPPTAAPVRPLADVSTTPRANYIGRAVVPTESPHEQRQAQNGDTPSENSRPAKRRKHEASPLSKSGYAQNLFGAPLSLSSWSASGQIRRSQETGDSQQTPAAPLTVPTGPTYRSQTTASLLQKIRRDQPLGGPVLADGTGKPMTARQTFSGRPQAAPTTAARSEAPPSNQQKQSARPKSQKTPFGKGTDATPKETPSRPSRHVPIADEAPSDDDVVETFSRPVQPSSSTRKRAPSPKASPPRKMKSTPKPFSALKAQFESRARVQGKPAPAKAVDQAPLNTPDLDEDDDVLEAPMLVSTTKPSRRRRLMLVSGPQASKGVVSSVESPIPPNTSRPVIRPPPAPIPEPVVSDQPGDQSPQPPAKRKSLSRAPSNPFVDFDSSSDSDVPLPKRRAKRPAPVSRTSQPRESEEENDTVPDSPPKSKQDSNPFSGDEAENFCSAKPREKSVPRQPSKAASPPPIDNPKPMDPAPAQAPAEMAHRFAAAGARLATLRRGVKSKEVLFWPRDEVSSEEEPEKPKEAKTKPPAATKSKSPVETVEVQEVPATTHATKASAREKESEPKETPQRRTSSRQTRQLSKTAEQKPDGLPAEPAPDVSPETTAHQQELPAKHPPAELAHAVPPKTTTQHESPGSAPPPVVVPEPSVPSAEAIQPTISSRAETVVQEPQQAKTVAAEPRKAPSPNSSSGQVDPVTKLILPVPEDKEDQVAPPATATLRRSTSATSTSAAPPANQPQIPGQRPRIVNPATRGRKAALKTDAAGQLPQTVVPAALPPATVNQLRMAVPVPMAVAVPVPVRKVSAPVVEKPKLPGFSRAGGGAWSKTAHDLLGMERPS